MKLIAVIPARGGSKSVPMKNIRPLHGKPLLAYSVDYARACSLVERIVVSTDSHEIVAVARASGAEVPFMRPAEFATDAAQDYGVFRHALDALEARYGETIDMIALLRPTSPLRPKGLIERAMELMERYPDATSVRSVAVSSEHPYRQWKRNGPYMEGVFPEVHESYNLPRQALPETLFQTGDLELIRRETLLSGSISGSRVLPLLIAHKEMIDIDTEQDFQQAVEQLVV